MWRVWPDGWYYHCPERMCWIREDGKWMRTEVDTLVGHPGQEIERWAGR